MARSLWRRCVPCALGDGALDWVEQVTPGSPGAWMSAPEVSLPAVDTAPQAGRE